MQVRNQEVGKGGVVVMLCTLEAKCQVDAEVKKQEVALCQQELALQQKRQEQFEAQMLHQQQHLQQQALQQQQQFNLQQQQSQQTQSLILALLQKMSQDKI